MKSISPFFAMLALTITGHLASAASNDSSDVSHGPLPYVGGWAETNLPGMRLGEFLVLGTFPEPGEPSPRGDRLSPQGLHVDYLAAEGGEANAAPRAGQVVKAAGVEVRWTRTTRPSDQAGESMRSAAVERSADLASGVSVKGGRLLYAYAEFEWNRDVAGALAYDVTDDARIWVNGAMVHERAAVLRWPRDEMHVAKVALKKGTNRILVKLRSAYGMRLLARIMTLEDARAYPVIAVRPRRLTPAGNPGAEFSLLTDDAFGGLHPEWPAEVTVLVPGGRVVAQANAKLGQVVTFKTNGWPEGPCEVRVTTSLPLSGPLAGYLPWYHGNLVAAVGKLRQLQAGDPATATDLVAYHVATASALRLAKVSDADSESLLAAAHHLLMEHAELENRKAGGPGGEHSDGFVRLAWRATNDASPQFCGVHLPPGYSRQKRWPMVVYLHGNDRNNRPYQLFYDEQRRRLPFAASHAIVIEPHGRGNVGYANMSEDDVLQCISLTTANLAVDPDRVYLTGYSMGGMGTEAIGARYPHLFAALGPAGAFLPLLDGASPEWAAASDVSRYRQLRREPAFESLWSTPVFAVIGEADAPRNVKGASDLAQRLQRWGYPVRLWTVPSMGHEMSFVFDGPGFGTQMTDMLRYRRDPAPARVRIKGMALTEGRVHWVQVMQRDSSLAPYEVDASVAVPGTLRLSTTGVLSIRAWIPSSLVGTAGALTVLWNGVETRVSPQADGSILVDAAGYRPGTGVIKTPERAGPAERAFAHSFLVVTGTGDGDESLRVGAAGVSTAIADTWRKQFHCGARMRLDADLTEREAAENTLVLVGTPKAGTPAAGLLAATGVTVGVEGVRFAGGEIRQKDPAAIILRPHPSNPGQYILLVQGTSAGAWQRLSDRTKMSGLFGTSVSPLPGGEFDYIVMGDAKTAQAGLWDWAWNVSPRMAFTLTDEEVVPRTGGRGSPATAPATTTSPRP